MLHCMGQQNSEPSRSLSANSAGSSPLEPRASTTVTTTTSTATGQRSGILQILSVSLVQWPSQDCGRLQNGHRACLSLGSVTYFAILCTTTSSSMPNRKLRHLRMIRGPIGTLTLSIHYSHTGDFFHADLPARVWTSNWQLINLHAPTVIEDHQFEGNLHTNPNTSCQVQRLTTMTACAGRACYI